MTKNQERLGQQSIIVNVNVASGEYAPPQVSRTQDTGQGEKPAKMPDCWCQCNSAEGAGAGAG